MYRLQMKRFLQLSVCIFFGQVIAWLPLHAFEIETRFAVIEYSNPETLQDFNYELYMGRLKSQIRKGDTLKEEITNKIDFIVEKVMRVLDMYQPELKFKIVLHDSKKKVQTDFKRIYNLAVDYIAFYSPSVNTVFYSAKHANLRVVAHEIGHVVAEHYFQVSPPPRIHEIMAQYAEKHVID